MTHVPSSPPGMEKSAGRMDHFCIFCARDMARSLARSMPACKAFSTFSSRRFKMSDIVVAELPMDLHHAMPDGLSLSVGSIVSVSMIVCKRELTLTHDYFYKWCTLNGNVHCYKVSLCRLLHTLLVSCTYQTSQDNSDHQPSRFLFPDQNLLQRAFRLNSQPP